VSLARDRGGACAILAAEAIHAAVVVAGAFDARDPEACTTVAFRAVEAATIAPHGVLIAVARPGDRPVVAALCCSKMGLGIESHAGDDGARAASCRRRRSRRRGWRWRTTRWGRYAFLGRAAAGARAARHEQQRENWTDCTGMSRPRLCHGIPTSFVRCGSGALRRLPATLAPGGSSYLLVLLALLVLLVWARRRFSLISLRCASPTSRTSVSDLPARRSLRAWRASSR